VEERLALLQERFPADPARALWQFLASTSRGVLQDRRAKKSTRDSGEGDEAQSSRSYPRAA